MMETEGFAKAVVGKGTERIPGFNIIGPMALRLSRKWSTWLRKREREIHHGPSDLIPETLRKLA